MPQTKRRGNVRQRRGGVDDSESESGEDRSVDFDEPSVSPDIPSQPLSRRSSNVEKPNPEDFASSLGASIERREELPPPPPPQLLQLKPQLQPQASSSRSNLLVSPVEARNYYDNELPHIATLSLPEPSPSSPMSAPTLPPIRPASDQQAAQRKRAATVPGKSVRQPSNSGPKVVACNFCRGSLQTLITAYRRESLPNSYSLVFPFFLLFLIQLVRQNVMARIQLARAVPAGLYHATTSTIPRPVRVVGQYKRKALAEHLLLNLLRIHRTPIHLPHLGWLQPHPAQTRMMRMIYTSFKIMRAR